ncbi:ABC transporter ATP-binding protein [Halorarum salinum]|uniref:ABC transporter ATP-binding protein n=1 Tax=Halorarum salinum TaxID=2743089 RepID=A0A7D5QJ50_9EURY|nr:ABC transporter ATP-binding protein [Halobaculum salinum]
MSNAERLHRSRRERSGTADADDEALVRCRGLTRRFRRGGGGLLGRSGSSTTVTAVDGVSMDVAPGEFVGVAGPSGSGKSTLLHLLAGLDVPTSGTVTLAGADTGSLSERERARLRLDRVGIVFQRFRLLPALSARANVAVPLVERGVPKAARRERATELLERVGLGDRTTHRPGELSGGERQRVAVARALVNDPDLLVADEPTGELDTAAGERVLALFEELASDRAVVLASHDSQALSRADRLVHLRDGRVVDGEDPADRAGDVVADRNGTDADDRDANVSGGRGTNGVAGRNGSDEDAA